MIPFAGLRSWSPHPFKWQLSVNETTGNDLPSPAQFIPGPSFRRNSPWLATSSLALQRPVSAATSHTVNHITAFNPSPSRRAGLRHTHPSLGFCRHAEANALQIRYGPERNPLGRPQNPLVPQGTRPSQRSSRPRPKPGPRTSHPTRPAHGVWLRLAKSTAPASLFNLPVRPRRGPLPRLDRRPAPRPLGLVLPPALHAPPQAEPLVGPQRGARRGVDGGREDDGRGPGPRWTPREPTGDGSGRTRGLRDIQMPADFRTALDRSECASDAFEGLNRAPEVLLPLEARDSTHGRSENAEDRAVRGYACRGKDVLDGAYAPSLFSGGSPPDPRLAALVARGRS